MPDKVLSRRDMFHGILYSLNTKQVERNKFGVIGWTRASFKFKREADDLNLQLFLKVIKRAL